MGFYDTISRVVGFRTVPTTVLLILIYAAIFSTVFVTDGLPKVPKNQRGLDIDQAYDDLHLIASRPHPYNSHSNDLVRSFLHDRVQSLASSHEHVHVIDDLVSNASWTSSGHGVYFEGTNLLVKVDGKDADKAGVLFSAHYDSVATAPGATDDGMGVSTLLALVEYFAEDRPERTVVFNFNNGEEDGLSGAHAFLEHPWSSIPDTFLNLEGAAAGGRPILFRATSTPPLYAFLNKNVPHPHSNVLSADAFARGAVRSYTDYSVYAQGLGGDTGMDGLDFAFYKGRSKYHTRIDGVPGIEGGRRALWAMMEGARGAGAALANDDATHGRGEEAVFFDLFAAVLIVIQMKTLLIINIVLLTVGPVLVALLVYTNYVSLRKSLRPYHTNSSSEGANAWRRAWTAFKRLGWLKALWRLAKFWLALIVGVGLQVLLVIGYVFLNPFIVYSQPYLVLTSCLSLAYLTTVLVLNLPIASQRALPEQQKLTIILQTYILTWLLLLASTVVVGKLKLGSVYFISAWNAVLVIGSALALVESISGAKGSAVSLDEEDNEVDGSERRYVSGIRYEVADSVEDGTQHATETETEPTEITPLISQRRAMSPLMYGKEESGALFWWILQSLVVIPVPAILVLHIGVLLLGSLSQTLADGSSPVTVYAATSLVAFLMILPMAPFSVKAHNALTALILVVFVASTAYNWLAFPFSQDDPLKVFFQQRVELDLSNNSSQLVRAETQLTGAKGYLEKGVLPQLPSSWKADVTCESDLTGLKPGLRTCAWASGLIPEPGTGLAERFAANQTWLHVNATRTGAQTARIAIKGVNTRSCRLYFDSAAITSYSVRGGATYLQPGYDIPPGGVNEVRLWSRTWDREWVVDVDWETRDENTDPDMAIAVKLEGRAACEWSEYQSAMAGAHAGGGRIPALEEVLSFLPRWAVVSKTTDGLVEAWGNFTV